MAELVDAPDGCTAIFTVENGDPEPLG